MTHPIEKQFIQVGDIQLHVAFAGPDDGEPLMFLHGFPEFWYGWRKQITYFAEQGYRVIVPDQRGYNLSDKPKDVNAYNINTLAEDIHNLTSVLGYEHVTLIGHDWGAAVAWWVATISPDVLDRLIILNVPHPIAMAKDLRRGNLRQMLKSWYIGAIQIPFVPEFALSLNNYNGFANMLRNTSNPGSFSDEDIDEYRIAWSQPNAIKSMLNWYRAMVRQQVSGGDTSYEVNLPIQVPTLMLWGENDVALSKELAQPSIDMCSNGELIFFPDATHWLQHDEADAVNQHIHDFVRQPVAIDTDD